MATTIQVTFRDMPVSDAVEARCWKEAAKLEQYFDRIIDCYVTVARSLRHQGKLFEVRINLTVPGRQFMVDREPAEHRLDEDIEFAIHEGFDRMRRQLQDYARRMRGQAKRPGYGGEPHGAGERNVQPRP